MIESDSRNPFLSGAREVDELLRRDLSHIRVEASTGGGMVTVHMTGALVVTRVEIEPELLDDMEMLQDMVRAAFNEASKRVQQQAQGYVADMLQKMERLGDRDEFDA